MSILIQRYQGGLTVRLAAGETFEIRRHTGRILLRITMGNDEASIKVETIPIATHDAGYDGLGNTGWHTEPTTEQRATDRGIPHDLRPSPSEDIKTGVRKRTQRTTRGKRT
ncbi:MAG: hypothetical protein AB1656_05130 [Candidatus Omnitrophota bacterium]